MKKYLFILLFLYPYLFAITLNDNEDEKKTIELLRELIHFKTVKNTKQTTEPNK